MKDDVISRQAAIDICLQYCPDDDGICSKNDDDLRNMLDEIEALPTVDAVKVVRCGECATRDKWGCPWWKDEARPDDWFCADGERRE